MAVDTFIYFWDAGGRGVGVGGSAICNVESSKHVYTKVTELVYRASKGFQNIRRALMNDCVSLFHTDY